MEPTTSLEPTHSPNYQGYKLPEHISEGERNTQLFSYASKLQAQEYSDEDIERMVIQANAERCNPPMAESEITRIVRNATSQPKGRDPEYERSYKSVARCAASVITVPDFITDITLSELFAKTYIGVLRWVPEVKGYYCYDGTRWVDAHAGSEERAERHIRRFVKDVGIAIASIDDEDERWKKQKAFLKYSNVKTYRNLLSGARAQMVTNINEFDRDSRLFNCRNVTVEFGKTIKTHSHTPDDLITKVANCDYDPNASYADWQKHLERTFEGYEDVIPFFQVCVGLAAAGDTDEDRFYIAIGQTRTGKSTTINAIKNVFGDYGTSAEAATFTAGRRNGASASPDYMALKGVRFVDVPELNEGMTLDAAFIKRLTGGDTIKARPLNGEQVQFRPNCTVFMNTNHKPRINDSTIFDSGRCVMLPFYNRLKEEERDKKLEEKMMGTEYANGILNWTIAGYIRAATIGLAVPETCLRITKEYAMEEDVIGAFIDQMCTVDDDAVSDGAVIYRAYKAWCKDNGINEIPSPKFYAKLRDRGYRKDRGRVGNKSVRSRIKGLRLGTD